MIQFSRYYMELLNLFFNNLASFFKSVWNTLTKALYYDVVDYFRTLINYSHRFNILDWLVFCIVFIISAAFVFFLILKVYQLVRRYFKFRKREIEKDELVEEIAILNQKTIELIDEKNKILAMKVSNLGIRPGEIIEYDRPAEAKKEVVNSRFPKLQMVDEEYKLKSYVTFMNPEDMIGLPQIVNQFVNFSASQLNLYYDQKTIRTFMAGMATSKIIILEGISGTGKTSLPYAFGKFIKSDTSIISVQPSWRDRAEILGYLNEFTKRFNETDFLKSLYEVSFKDNLNLIVLDEMNLARIEYYFADFLSIMEMPDVSEWKIDLVPNGIAGDPKHLVDGKIMVPQNVWFVGTANRDDSTFTITDKVYDRAVSIEINNRAKFIDAPITDSLNISFDYLDNLFKRAQIEFSISNKNLENFDKLDQFIQEKFKIAFGNRILKQIKAFVPVYIAAGGDELEAIDYMLHRKILRKFEDLNLSFLKNEIDQLITLLDKLFGKNTFKDSIQYLRLLQKIS